MYFKWLNWFLLFSRQDDVMFTRNSRQAFRWTARPPVPRPRSLYGAPGWLVRPTAKTDCLSICLSLILSAWGLLTLYAGNPTTRSHSLSLYWMKCSQEAVRCPGNMGFAVKFGRISQLCFVSENSSFLICKINVCFPLSSKREVAHLF